MQISNTTPGDFYIEFEEELQDMHLSRGKNGSLRLKTSFFNPSDNIGIIAINNKSKKIIGRMRGVLYKSMTGEESGTYTSSFSFVSAKHRGKGIGFAMWSKLIAEKWINKVYVTTLSHRSFMLIQKLQREFPNVEFMITDNRTIKKFKIKTKSAVEKTPTQLFGG